MVKVFFERTLAINDLHMLRARVDGQEYNHQQ
jgi:hypothetical protein